MIDPLHVAGRSGRGRAGARAKRHTVTVIPNHPGRPVVGLRILRRKGCSANSKIGSLLPFRAPDEVEGDVTGLITGRSRDCCRDDLAGSPSSAKENPAKGITRAQDRPADRKLGREDTDIADCADISGSQTASTVILECDCNAGRKGFITPQHPARHGLTRSIRKARSSMARHRRAPLVRAPLPNMS